MGKTGYFCFMLVLKLLNVKSNNVQFDYFSDDSSMTDVHIVRAAKEMQLKVKISKFNKKRIRNYSEPPLAQYDFGITV